CGRKLTTVASNNFLAALGNEGPPKTFFCAPSKLRTNRRMADQRAAAFANQGAGQRRAVADVNLHLSQRRLAVVDEEEIRPVKNQGTTRANAVSHSRSQDRVLDRERFESDAANLGGHAFLNQLATPKAFASPDFFGVVDLAASQCSPRLLRRMHRARRAVSQSP